MEGEGTTGSAATSPEATRAETPGLSAGPLPDLTDEYFNEPVFESAKLRMQHFVKEWVTNGHNAAAAARAAGYSEVCASAQGNRLLKMVYVQRLIRNILGSEPYQVPEAEEGVRQHLLAVRDANLATYFTVDATGIPKVDLLNLTEEQGKAMQSLKVNRFGEIEIKLKDSLKAAELLGRTHKMFVDKHELFGPGGVPLVPPVINVTFVDAPKKEEEAA